MRKRLSTDGRMSQSTKRKHVTKEVLDEFRLPQNNEKVVQVLGGRGNNLHEVYDPSWQNTEGIGNGVVPDNKKYLVSMPTKFRKNVWIKRGDYVVVEPIVEGDKVKAEIIQILYKEQIKYVKEQGLWPSEFTDDSKIEGSKSSVQQKQKAPFETASNCDSENSDDESDLFQNTNRPKVENIQESSESSSSEGD